MSELIGKILGRYQITSVIGHGGMNTVYKGRQIDGEQTVAIKVLAHYLAQDPLGVGRFQREAKLLRKLQHPNIIPILDYGDVDGRPYIVMPYLTAGTLKDRLSHGPLSPEEGARYLSQISSALEFAHQNGVVHRDLKPSNIMLNDDGDALLTDFGLAYVFDASHSLTGSALIGTPAYMSPEQCTSGTVNAQSDQYSLGVMLYELTTGRLPYIADSPVRILIQHLNEPVPQPSTVSAKLPKPVESILLKAMHKDPSMRFGSVTEMNDAFQQAMVESLDSQGRLRPEPVYLSDAAKIFETPHDGQKHQKKAVAWPIARRSLVGFAILLLVVFAFPLFSREFMTIYPSGAGAGEDGPPVAFANPTDLMATIDALSTVNVSLLGDEIDPDVIETVVAQTMSAMLIEPSSTSPPVGSNPTLAASSSPFATEAVFAAQTSSATPGPSPSPTISRSPTPSRTAGPSPTPSYTPTETRTATPGPSPTPTMSQTQAPSPTPTLVPTRTARPSHTPKPTTSPTMTETPTSVVIPVDTNTPSPTVTRTPTITPTRTQTPTRTFTATVTWTVTSTHTPQTTSMHVGDLDGSSTNLGNTWIALVTITIHDANHNPVANAHVSGEWSLDGAQASCTTGSTGRCTVTSAGIRKRNNEIRFTIQNVSHGSMSYAPGDNHDPDGDSNGSRIVIKKP